MPPNPHATSKIQPLSWATALKLLVAALLFWALAAAALYIAAPGVDSFGRLLVFSEAVGMAILAIALLLRPARWFPRVSPARGWLVTGVLAIPAGYIVGHLLATFILGEPFRLSSPGHDRLVPVVFTVLLAGSGLHYFAAREHLAKEATARSEAQRLATETELRLLRAQLEPHMLFNTLANLRSLVRDDAPQAERMIDQLISYLRSVLAASRTEFNPLRDEFAQLRAYLEIMAVRMGPRLSYRLELPAELERLDVPSMLLQPLVENAVKHGIEPRVGPGRVEVMARRGEAGVEIAVSDNGLGLLPGAPSGRTLPSASGSYGLLHVRERLRAVYGSEASLTLTPLVPEGLSAVVRIPS